MSAERVIVGAFFAAHLLVAGPPPLHAAETIPWQVDLAAASARARATNRLILLDFQAGWCETCVEEEHSVFVDRRVVDAAKRFVPVRIDYDGSRPVATRHNVTALPTMLVIDPSGAEVFRFTGKQDAKALSEKLQSLAK